ncbi:MAG: LysM peptidoglycan-binding domain-containing protein [Chitinophagaceae bacterium]|nr:LysM peptidoglycan-binding domain-containing protein [Chitinophagaceae bacterium]
MKNLTRALFKFLMRLLMTPLLLLVTIVILVAYTLAGCVLVPAHTLRYMSLTTLAAVQSAFLNRDYTNIFLDGLYEFFKKYVSFYGHIFYIPLAIWVPAQENPSNLLKLLEYQWKVISENWLSTIIVFSTLIFSFALSFSLLGIKALDYFHLDRLKEKIFTSSNSSEIITDTTATFQLGLANNKIDSLQTVIDNYKKEHKKEIEEGKKENSLLDTKVGQKTYLVQPGDGLYSVARKNKVSINQLREWNNLTGDDLRIGQKLIVSK